MTESHGTMEAHGAIFDADGAKRESMVERVAGVVAQYAIYPCGDGKGLFYIYDTKIWREQCANLTQPSRPNRVNEGMWEWHEAEDQMNLMNARAAIAAMREPTEAMIQAGDWPMHGEALPPDLMWQAMIDEALNTPDK